MQQGHSETILTGRCGLGRVGNKDAEAGWDQSMEVPENLGRDSTATTKVSEVKGCLMKGLYQETH